MQTTKNIPLLLGALAVVLLPHIPRLPLWVMFWFVIAWGNILVVIKYRLPLPGKALRLVLTIGGTAVVLLTTGFSLDRYSSVALLWIMASIKLMESRTYRDEMVTIFLIYFLAVSSLFFSSSFAVGLYMAFSIGVTTAVLIHIHQPRSKFSGNLGLSATLMLKALPLTLILFVVFPRIHGSLWGMRSPATAQSGFSDRLTPGSITHLVRNNDIAFRVEFDGRIPEPDRLYWRGLVFWFFDGQSWQHSRNSLYFDTPLKGRNPVAYTITLEPHNQRWLFALDLPYKFGSQASFLSDHTLTSRWIVRQRIQYRVKSYITYNTGPLWEWESEALQTPWGKNPQATALARKWRADSNSMAGVVNTALRHFQSNNFSYTLNPPPLGDESIDYFLFKTRKGYCEQYASAFAFLMRAAGVPARIVAGYLGGELNPYGKYLIVRQSDAHVWVEVRLPGKGWVRIDPTLSVAPERIEQGAAAALPPEERSTLKAFTGSGPLAKYWLNLELGWDAINNQWNKWVLGYSNNMQKTLFTKIGIKAGTWAGLAKAIILGIGLMGVLSILYFFRFIGRPPGKTDNVQHSYIKFCDKLDRIGLARTPSQGPLDFTEMVIAIRKDLKTSVLDIVNLYISLRYAGNTNKDDLKRLKVLVRQFSPYNGDIS
jgi:transglutaminase-like putative cysteine protease